MPEFTTFWIFFKVKNWNEKWKKFNLNHETCQKHEIHKNIDHNVIEVIAVISSVLNE